MDRLLGCLKNNILHMSAIAGKNDMGLNIGIANEIFEITPSLLHSALAGYYEAYDYI